MIAITLVAAGVAAVLTVTGWLLGFQIGPLRAWPVTAGAVAAWAVAAVVGGLSIVGVLVDDRPADEGIGWW